MEVIKNYIAAVYNNDLFFILLWVRLPVYTILTRAIFGHTDFFFFFSNTLIKYKTPSKDSANDFTPIYRLKVYFIR